MNIRLTSFACVTVCAALAAGFFTSSRAGTAAAAPPAAHAPAPPPVPDAQVSAQALEVARTRLKLTPDQTEKMRPLMEAYIPKLRGLFQEYTNAGVAGLPAFMQEFKKTRDDFRATVFAFLSEPQKTSFDDLRREVDVDLREQICTQRIALLKERLALTPQQETALRPILKDDFEKKRVLLLVQTDPKGGSATRRPIDDELRKVQAETEGALSGVLTPDQMKTYRADREAIEARAASKS